jgi:hypothetical protein
MTATRLAETVETPQHSARPGPETQSYTANGLYLLCTKRRANKKWWNAQSLNTETNSEELGGLKRYPLTYVMSSCGRNKSDNWRTEFFDLYYLSTVVGNLWNTRGNLMVNSFYRRSQRPRGLRQELSSLARTLGSWIRIPLEAWMSVFCVFILYYAFYAGSGLATYRLCIGWRNSKSGHGPTKGCRAVIIIIIIKYRIYLIGDKAFVIFFLINFLKGPIPFDYET